jgi:hypothetical protein
VRGDGPAPHWTSGTVRVRTCAQATSTSSACSRSPQARVVEAWQNGYPLTRFVTHMEWALTQLHERRTGLSGNGN